MRLVLRIIGILLALVAGAGLGIALVVNDRFVWSQYVVWVPREVWLGVGAVGVGIAGATLKTRRVALMVSCALLVLSVWPWIATSSRERRGFSIAWWNMSRHSIEDIGALDGVDLAIVAYPEGDASASVRSSRAHHRSAMGIVASSTVPIDRFEGISLGFEATHRNSPWNDRGRALVLEVADRVIWVVDLPSDPALSREWVAKEASARIASAGFPAPDVVLGDFNITRGSRSLRHLDGGLPGAHTQAGRGLGLTFPRDLPLVAIDLVFASGVHRHEVVDPGAGSHRVVRVWME